MKAQLERVPIESLCRNVTSGGTPSRVNSRYWEDGSIPWFKTAELKDWYVEDAEEKISEEGLANSAAKIFPADTVLMAMYGDGRTITSLGILRNEAATNQACCALISDPAKCHFLYLFYALKFHRHELLKLVVAGAQRNLSGGIIRKFKIFFRPLPVQQSIAETLSAYDELMENNRRRMGLLEEAARLLYREWFVRLRFPGHEHASITHGIPEGWKKNPLGVLAEVTMGQSPESKFYNETGDGLPFHQGVADFGDRFVTNRIYTTALNRIANAGDILCSVRAPVGRLNTTLDKIVIGRGLAALRSRSGNQSFLLHQLRTHFFKEDLIGAGAIFASVTKTEFGSQMLLTPPCRLIQEFEDFSGPIDEQLRVLHLQNQKLRAARDLLLPRLMSGEISA